MCVRTNECAKLVFVFSVRNINIFERNLTLFTVLPCIKSVAAKRCDLTGRTGLGKSKSVELRKNRPKKSVFVEKHYLTPPLSGVGHFSEFSRTIAISRWNPAYNAFHRIFFVEMKRFVDSSVHVILTRQTCGQGSSRAAESKPRALGALENCFPEQICYMFLISKCR